MRSIRSIRSARRFLAVTWDTAADLCTVQDATLGPIPEGTVATYRELQSAERPTSEVVLVTPNGATATGRCTSSRRGRGTCTFAWGTGWLAGFHASLKVTTSSDGAVSWEGTYYFAPTA
jgi:hypothetical protein